MKAKKERRELARLYSKIPTFKCIEGCSDCCGPVPASREERKQAPNLMEPETALTIIDVLAAGGASEQELAIAPKLTEWADAGGICITCPYVVANGGGCAIYDNRPFLCRLFGTVASMPCPHGAAPEEMLSRQDERELMKDYHRLIEKTGEGRY